MDLLVSLGGDPILAVSKNTNENILGFFFTDGEIDYKWILRDTDKTILEVSEVPFYERMFMDVSLKALDDGRIKVKFGIPIALDSRDLFFSRLPPKFNQKYGIIFECDDGLSYLKEVYVDFNTSTSFCRCVVIDSEKEFVEQVPVNLALLKF